MSKDNSQQRTMSICIEVDYDEYVEREIPIEQNNFLSVSQEALNIMVKLGKQGKSCFCVYCVLLSHRNRRNNKCFPSIDTICKESNLSERTVKDILISLSDNGYLIINSGHSGSSNNYYFPKEWFYKYFKDDISQKNAKRRKNEKSKNRNDKTKELKKENEELKQENNQLKEDIKEIKGKNKAIQNKLNKLEQNKFNKIDNSYSQNTGMSEKQKEEFRKFLSEHEFKPPEEITIVRTR